MLCRKVLIRSFRAMMPMESSHSSGSFSFNKLGFSCLFCALLLLVQTLVISCSTTPSNIQSNPSLPSIVILGDSTVDAGVNNYLVTIIKSNFPPYGRDFVYGDDTGKPTGRFCNGKLIPDLLAERVGLPFSLAYGDPKATGTNILQGINVASSGSGWYDGTAALYNVISLPKQVEWVEEWQNNLVAVIGAASAATRVREAVYVISTGSNDWVNYYYSLPDVQIRYSKPAFRQLILDSATKNIEALYQSGARRIAIASLPPLGCLPSQITNHGDGNTRNCVSWIQEDSQILNQELEEHISSLKSAVPEATLLLLDAFTPVVDAILNPTKYGLLDTNRGCCGTGLYEVGIFCTHLQPICADPSHYLWWDSFHPTEYFNKIIGDLFWKKIIEAFQITV